MKPTSFAIGVAVIACSVALSGPLAAEMVSFPKDNPVFTIEVPANQKASFNEHGVLMIGADEFRLTDLKKASVASEDEAKKWIRMFVTAFADGRLAAAVTPKVEVKKEEIAPGLSGYVSRVCSQLSRPAVSIPLPLQFSRLPTAGPFTWTVSRLRVAGQTSGRSLPPSS